MISTNADLRTELAAAMSGVGVPAADRLCEACVDLLPVDGAAISLMDEGSTYGTFGSSGELSRRLDEFQFTFGEGPCLDSIASQRPILVSDLASPSGQRWPAYSGAVLQAGVRGVFAMPISIARTSVGVLDLFRYASGPLSVTGLAGGLLAAQLAALPLMDVITNDLSVTDLDPPEGTSERQAWAALSSLERVEVYQATGMIMEHLGVGPSEALVRLRAHAFATDRTASEVAWAVIDRRLLLDDDVRHHGGDVGPIE